MRWTIKSAIKLGGYASILTYIRCAYIPFNRHLTSIQQRP